MPELIPPLDPARLAAYDDAIAAARRASELLDAMRVRGGHVYDASRWEAEAARAYEEAVLRWHDIAAHTQLAMFVLINDLEVTRARIERREIW